MIEWDAYLFSKGGVSRWFKDIDSETFADRGWYRFEDRQLVRYTNEEYRLLQTAETLEQCYNEMQSDIVIELSWEPEWGPEDYE